MILNLSPKTTCFERHFLWPVGQTGSISILVHVVDFLLLLCKYLTYMYDSFPNCVLYQKCSHFRFDDKEAVSGVNNVKSSVQKGIRSKLVEQYPYIEDYLDQIVPKKDLKVAKWFVSCSFVLILLE